MDLLPYTSYRERPKDWLSEWVALHHSHCIVGEGIRRWLDQVEEEEARKTLAELVAGYPQTRAAAAAREWLRAGPGRGREQHLEAGRVVDISTTRSNGVPNIKNFDMVVGMS